MPDESTPSARRQNFGVPIVLACGALAVLAASFVVPAQWLYVLQDIVALGLFAVATNLLVGYGGLVSFGQAVFYGLGAYTMALGWQRWHAPFSLLFFTIANRWYDFTGGDNGVFGAMIPPTLALPRHGLWFVLAVSFVALLLLWAITVSPFGLTLRAIRENAQRVEAIGVNLRRHQLYAFTISGAFCALAGTLFVVHDQSAFPGLFQWTQSGEPILMAMIGGMNWFLGPFVGAIIFIVAHNYLVANAASAWKLILGIVLVLIVLFAPDGLLGLWGSRASAPRRRARLRALLSGRRSAGKSR